MEKIMKKNLKLALFAISFGPVLAMSQPEKRRKLQDYLCDYDIKKCRICRDKHEELIDPQQPLAELRTILKNNLISLEPWTPEARLGALVSGFDTCLTHTQLLLELWHDKIDINYPRAQKTMLDKETTFFNTVFDIYCQKAHCPEHNDTTIYIENLHNVYVYICQAFKDTININIQRDDKTPFMEICDRFIRLKKPGNLRFKMPGNELDIVLENFLQEFNTKIDIETTNKHGQTVFDICNSTKTFHNDYMCWIEDNDMNNQHIPANKKNLLVLLKKYFPDKLCFTKERLENLNNCRFRFMRNYGE